MVSSTSELTDWRTRYPKYYGATGADPNDPTDHLNWWDMMRKRSWQAQDAINNMPRVFDPTKVAGLSMDQIAQAILPGSRSFTGGLGGGAAALPATPAAAAPADPAALAPPPPPAPSAAAPPGGFDASAISPGYLSALVNGVSGAEQIAGFGGGGGAFPATPAVPAPAPYNPPPEAGLLAMLQADPGQVNFGFDPTTLMAMLKGGK
jgi:hypothetical protein